MKLPDSDMATLAVLLQGCLRACGEDLANDVPWQHAADPNEHRKRIAAWMRRAMALLSTRLDEIPEGLTVDRREASRRLHDASLLGINAILADPVLSPLIPESERQDIEDGLRSFDEVWNAVERGLAGEQPCPECGTTMQVMFTSAECPACGTRMAQS